MHCESIDQILTRFIAIINGLVSLGKPISNDQKLWKMLKALPKSWEVKTTILKEFNDKEEMDHRFRGELEDPWNGDECKRRT